MVFSNFFGVLTYFLMPAFGPDIRLGSRLGVSNRNQLIKRQIIFEPDLICINPAISHSF